MSHHESLERVLYIEDEEDIRIVADIALKTIGGLDTRCCASGPEGLAALETFPAQLILLDVMMPGMDGPSVLSEIRNNEQYQNTPVVFITAKVQADEVDQLLSLGANAVISKPFEPMDMAQKLRDIWEDFHRA
ncbi:response regulator [Spongiibacter marinus]|uniref:response regulator n=1 Tax=Spongiibacter marinus TaxID=354246 RepID=UPI00041B56C2|nr:response regulator [Spongiibacter marinus]